MFQILVLRDIGIIAFATNVNETRDMHIQCHACQTPGHGASYIYQFNCLLIIFADHVLDCMCEWLYGVQLLQATMREDLHCMSVLGKQ